jgi:hypothetical protein
MVSILLASCSISEAKEETMMPPDIWQIKQAVDGAGCIDLTGEYQLWGEAAPQGPATFRGMSFSLDVMAGPYVSNSDRKEITHVGVEHRDGNEITFKFFTQGGILTQRKYYPSEKVQILCTADRVTVIQKSLETRGEATSGTADITDTYFLSNDGSLIIHTVIKWVDSILFIFKIPQEEQYWAKFKAVGGKR